MLDCFIVAGVKRALAENKDGCWRIKLNIPDIESLAPFEAEEGDGLLLGLQLWLQ